MKAIYSCLHINLDVICEITACFWSFIAVENPGIFSILMIGLNSFNALYVYKQIWKEKRKKTNLEMNSQRK